MNLWRLNNHLNDALRYDGDICLVNLDHAAAFKNMTLIGEAASRTIHTELQDETEYCFIFLNSTSLTEAVLDKAWKLVTYGGTIFFSSYGKTGVPSDRIITNFLKMRSSDITEARQMLLNGKREHNLIVKCFDPSKKPSHPMDEEPVTIATVLKSGGEYTVDYVNHIANSIHENVTIPYKFVCLTDFADGFGPNVHQIVPFDNDFPKWWGKIELFKPGKFEASKIFYLDLDTIIIRNIDSIIKYGGEFFGLRDFYHQYGLGSGLMCWKNNTPRLFQIYERFMENPTAHMNNNRFGDQEFIGGILGKNMDYVQDLYPKQIVSYKKDCVNPVGGKVEIPRTAHIICFHGPPRPHQVKDPVLSKYWRG